MAEISEAISMIKKAESDAVTTVEDANVKSEDLIKDATSKASQIVVDAKGSATHEAEVTVFNKTVPSVFVEAVQFDISKAVAVKPQTGRFIGTKRTAGDH